MSTRDQDAPTVVRSVSLTDTGPREPASDDAPTSVYALGALRATAPERTEPPARPRALRQAAATLQTMTVRAVAALSGPVTGSARARRAAVRPRRPSARRAALIGLAIASWLGALLGGAWLATTLGGDAPPPPTARARVAPARPPRPAEPATATTAPTPAPPPALPPPAAASAAPSAAAPRAKPPAPRRHRPSTPAIAADQLASGDYAAALASYTRLATDRPDEPVYAAIVEMLERDLARRCDPTLPARDPACPP